MQTTTAPETNFHAEQLVRIKPEWDGDDRLFLITEWNEDRGYIVPLEWDHGRFRPSELVRAHMIEDAS